MKPRSISLKISGCSRNEWCPGAVDDLELAARLGGGDQVEQRIALFERRRRVVPTPDYLGRLAHAAVADPGEHLRLVLRQAGQEHFRLESLVLHLADGFLELGQARHLHRGIQECVVYVVGAVGIVLIDPFLAFAAQMRPGRAGMHDVVKTAAGRAGCCCRRSCTTRPARAVPASGGRPDSRPANGPPDARRRVRARG